MTTMMKEEIQNKSKANTQFVSLENAVVQKNIMTASSLPHLLNASKLQIHVWFLLSV